jgi:hypothetical protein
MTFCQFFKLGSVECDERNKFSVSGKGTCAVFHKNIVHGVASTGRDLNEVPSEYLARSVNTASHCETRGCCHLEFRGL